MDESKIKIALKKVPKKNKLEVKKVVDFLTELNGCFDNVKSIETNKSGLTTISLFTNIGGFSIKNGIDSYSEYNFESRQNLDLLKELQTINDVLNIICCDEIGEKKAMILLRRYKKQNPNFKTILKFMINNNYKWRDITIKLANGVDENGSKS